MRKTGTRKRAERPSRATEKDPPGMFHGRLRRGARSSLRKTATPERPSTEPAAERNAERICARFDDRPARSGGMPLEPQMQAAASTMRRLIAVRTRSS
jgi:hypothetical protein